MNARKLNTFGNFSELTVKLNKLNKLFMSRIDNELQFNGIHEINATQALMLVNIGNNKTTLANAQTNGYYLGKNISYNVNLLLNKGYITKEDSDLDKRCVYMCVTDKGAAVVDLINQNLLSHQQSLTKAGVKDTFVSNINSIIDKLHRVLDNNSRI